MKKGARREARGIGSPEQLDDEVKHSQWTMGGLPGGSEAGFVSSLMLFVRLVATNSVWLGFGIS